MCALITLKNGLETGKMTLRMRLKWLMRKRVSRWWCITGQTRTLLRSTQLALVCATLVSLVPVSIPHRTRDLRRTMLILRWMTPEKAKLRRCLCTSRCKTRLFGICRTKVPTLPERHWPLPVSSARRCAETLRHLATRKNVKSSTVPCGSRVTTA